MPCESATVPAAVNPCFRYGSKCLQDYATVLIGGMGRPCGGMSQKTCHCVTDFTLTVNER